MSEQHAHGHNHTDRASMSSTPKTGIFLDIREVHSVLREECAPQWAPWAASALYACINLWPGQTGVSCAQSCTTGPLMYRVYAR